MKDPLFVTLRRLREAAGLSLTDVQRQTGIKAVVVGSYERGQRNPQVSTLRELFAFYGYDLTATPIGQKSVRPLDDIAGDLRGIADYLESRNAGVLPAPEEYATSPAQ